MEQKQNRIETDSAQMVEGCRTTTIFEQAIDIQVELAKSVDLPGDLLPVKPKRELPKWVLKIHERFRKTILKPVLKLRPNGTMNWRNYGRMIGIIERKKAFLLHDIPRILKEEGFDSISDERWERIRAMLGEEKLRQCLIKVLRRPVADEEPLEKLADEVLERQLKHDEELKSIAFYHVAQQDAKTTALFYKGLAEGYTCFLDKNGFFSGDRGRTSIYFDLLSCQLEIEKYRRTMPVKSRRDLQRWVINEARIRITNDDDWFDHLCDEICLSMKGVGRKPKPQIC